MKTVEHSLPRAIGRLGIALIALTLSCTDVSVAPRSTPIRIISGDRQVGLARKELAEPLYVAVRDAAGSPVPNAIVVWSASDGGLVSPDSSITDENGIAAARWTLGDSPGVQHASAHSDQGDVTFEATASSNDPSSIVLLSLSTPDGSGQTVHPDYAHAQTSGASYLVVTPYPGGNAAFENPSLFVGTSPSDWRVPGGVTNPLVHPGPGEYLSDPDIVEVPERGELWVYYRAVSTRNIVRLIRSTDGIRFSVPVEVASANNHDLVSPTVVHRAPDDWMMWSVSSNVGCSASTTAVELRHSIDGIHWGPAAKVNLDQPGFFPWHIDVQWIPSRSEFWAVFNGKVSGSCTTRALFLAVSADGVTWKTFPSPILQRGAIPAFEDVVYRSTFAYDPVSDAVDLWYSGARYDGHDYVWRTAHQRRNRKELFATAMNPVRASLSSLDARFVPELRDPP